MSISRFAIRPSSRDAIGVPEKETHAKNHTVPLVRLAGRRSSQLLHLGLQEDSKILRIARYGAAGPGPAGSVMTVEFELHGQRFIALNGGPHFKFSEAISFSVDCKTQEEVDELWNKLVEGGQESQCGWLKDKYGLSWQINPGILGKLLSDPDPAKAKRVMEAMMKMKKIDIAELQKAYDNK